MITNKPHELTAIEIACGVTLDDIARELPRGVSLDGWQTFHVPADLSPALASAVARCALGAPVEYLGKSPLGRKYGRASHPRKDTMELTPILVTAAQVGMETRHGIVTDIIDNHEAGEGYLDFYIDDSWVGTVSPKTVLRVYLTEHERATIATSATIAP